MSFPPQFIFAGGGTGGHLFPGVAIAEALAESDAHVDILFLCTTRAVDERILTAAGFDHAVLPVRPLRVHPLHMPAFVSAWNKSLKLCRRRFNDRRPAVVIGTGGFGSGPAVRVAARLGIPTALLNPDAIPGRANRFLARSARRIFLQWPESAACFRPGAEIESPGCPVRRGFESPSGSATDFGLSEDRRTLLVTGASSGARTINDALMQLTADLGRRGDWQVLHIAGGRDVDRLTRGYEQAGVAARVVDFIDDMPAALSSADLVLGRAGAVTLAELAVAGQPAVLMPYPFHADDHQTHNANHLARRDAAVVVQDRKEPQSNAAALRAVLLPLMDDGAALARMAAAARRCARPEAARDVAASLLNLAGLDRAADSARPLSVQ